MWYLKSAAIVMVGIKWDSLTTIPWQICNSIMAVLYRDFSSVNSIFLDTLLVVFTLLGEQHR